MYMNYSIVEVSDGCSIHIRPTIIMNISNCITKLDLYSIDQVDVCTVCSLRYVIKQIQFLGRKNNLSSLKKYFL